jgi:hypothetical protein
MSWHHQPEIDMSSICMIRQAAATVRHLRRVGLHAQARTVAFEARRAIGAAALRRSVA